MRLKLFALSIGLLTTFISAFSLVFIILEKPPTQQSEKTIIFKNRNATLLLEENLAQKQEFTAYLHVAIPQCTGALAEKEDGGIPAKAFFKTGDFQNGLLEIHQPPTMGEAACDLELHLQKNEIITAKQQGGDCEAWHGKSCAFSTPILGGMKR